MGLKHFVWYERHRPQNISEMVLPEQYVKNFSEYISAESIPHLLFFGPAGSGKTTMAFILMDSLSCSRLVLNASSKDRGIETMRGKVKNFASSKSLDGKPKIVFFDEADGMLKDAQRALKNTIEAYSTQCRFIFTCNEIDRIDDAIKSRCVKYEFTALPQDQLFSQLETILIKEGVSYSKEDVEKIISQNPGDVRSIVNTLQTCSIGGRLDPAVVSKSVIDPNAVLDYILDGEIGKLRLLLSGISDFGFLYKFLFSILLETDDLNQEEKKEIVELMSEHLYRDAVIINREINFIACAVGLAGILGCKKISFTI